MSPTLCVTRFTLVVLLLGCAAIPARAQTLTSPVPSNDRPTGLLPVETPLVLPPGIAISRTVDGMTGHPIRNETPAAQAVTRSGHRATRWGIAVGAVAAASVTAWAASSYGENEGGRFCSRCFMQWSALSIPVGATAGAGVGYLIDWLHR
jgi:hypothetical protein